MSHPCCGLLSEAVSLILLAIPAAGPRKTAGGRGEPLVSTPFQSGTISFRRGVSLDRMRFDGLDQEILVRFIGRRRRDLRLTRKALRNSSGAWTAKAPMFRKME